MKTYHFKKIVGTDGLIRLSEDPTDVLSDMQRWFADIRTRHPFAAMSKEEILRELRQTRETVWVERHADEFRH
ncbi:hypothetical protein GF339_21420 [candidate division KSB3 bacterium]|uniref:Uncharacterized protein n=1 Tax=candidate division KSB3 bacterium TaxID=2044937 RepID=A0A9D5JZT0_9BACT|nr:hypothetical protein [candidate division KSB3 bacterium]MBD3327160.1 hypothetical protein [candidate division KSB3 bacterium]